MLKYIIKSILNKLKTMYNNLIVNTDMIQMVSAMET